MELSKVSGRELLIPVGYSTHPIPSQHPRPSGFPPNPPIKIKALLKPPQTIHQLGHIWFPFPWTRESRPEHMWVLLM